MGKYDDAIGGGEIILDVVETLNEAAAGRVDKRIKQQKAEWEQPIELNVKSDAALNKLAELSKLAKQTKTDMEAAMAAGSNFKNLYPLVAQYEKLSKEVKKLTPDIGKNNAALKESNAILRETGKLVDSLMGVERKPRKSRAKTAIQEELSLLKQVEQEEAKLAATQSKLAFADGTFLNANQVKAVEKYCSILKKSMGEAYNEAKTLQHALELVFDIGQGNIANIMGRFTNGNSASNAVLKMLTGMDVNNQKNRDAALRSINPDVYDKLMAEQKVAAEQARAELKSQQSAFQKQWAEFVSTMLGGDAFANESKLVKGKILKAFSEYGTTAAAAIHEINKAWLSGGLDGKFANNKWIQSYVSHLDNQREYINAIRDAKAGDLDTDSLFELSGTTGMSEEKAQALRDEAAAWDELIARKKEYYNLELQQANVVDVQVQDNKKLTSSYEGLAQAVEEFVAAHAKVRAKTDMDDEYWALSRIEEEKRRAVTNFVPEDTRAHQDAYASLAYLLNRRERNELVPAENILQQIERYIKRANTEISKSKLNEARELVARLQSEYVNDYGNIFGDVFKKYGKLNTESSSYIYDALIAKEQEYKAALVSGVTPEVQQQTNHLKEIVQLVDNYGHELDEVNNKLMQGTKLLNEQGQILRLFHNSENIFDSFDLTKAGSNQGQALGLGNYLALHQNGEFNDTTYGRYQTQWYANVQNPFRAGDKLTDKQSAAVIDKFMADRAESFKQHMLSKLLDGDIITAIKDIADIGKVTAGDIYSYLNYDAVMDGAQINVFDPSKIYRANDSVLDIGTDDFSAFKELRKAIWNERRAIENANHQIRQLSNEYSGKTADELDFALGIETMSKGFGWQKSVAKIASAFKELTGELPKSNDISEDSMRALVENYEFTKQSLQEYKNAILEHEAVLNKLVPQLDVQKATIDSITQSYLSGSVSGIVNKEVLPVASSAKNITQENNKLISSYEGLAEAVERYVDASKKLWDAYDKHADFDAFAVERNAAADQIASMFPNGYIDGGTDARLMLQSQEMSRMYAQQGAEESLKQIEGYLTKSKEEQARLTADVAKQTEAQAQAEEKLAASAERTADAKKQQASAVSDVSVEEIVSRDIERALAQLRSAQHNETSLFTLKGVFEGDDLITQAESMVKQIAELSNLSLGKFTVKDDIIKVQLYNEQLKITVDQLYQLKAATEDAESAQLQLTSQSFSQNVKALNANNFDVEGVQQRALAAIAKVRASLHGLAYDLSDLESAALGITSQDDFNKFNNQLKAAQDNIQAIKSSTVSKSSMNPLANMQRDMQNANIEIDTMRMKLEKFGNIQGVAEATQMLNQMTAAVQQYHNATDATGQQAAYNQYSDLRSSFKAQTEYINAAKSLNDSQKSTSKIREQYNSILQLINQINTANERMINLQSKDGGSGIFGKQMQAEIEKKTMAVEKLQAVMSQLNTGDVLGNDQYFVPDDIQSIGTDYSQIAAFIRDAGVQAELTTTEIDKLVSALTKAGDIDMSMLGTLFETTTAKAQAKQMAYEQQYFAGKTPVTEDLNIDAVQQLGEASDATRVKLENMAQTFAQTSGASNAFVTGFTQGTDGISKLDFSVFDSATNSMRTFRMEMGSVTDGMFVTETTVSKSLANIRAAQKQLGSTSDLIGRLSVSGVNTIDGTAPQQITKLLELSRQLSAELSKGDGADNNIISKLTKDLQFASGEAERLYRQMLQMESLISSGQAISVGTIDPTGDVYGQLAAKAQEYAQTQHGATLEVGAFDSTTNTLNASLVRANGSVEQFKMQMYGLGGEVAQQQVGVGRLTNSWHTFTATFKNSISRYMSMFTGFYMFYRVIAVIREGINEVKELDSAMTELKKVTDETAEAYESFLTKSAQTAGTIGATVSEFTEATANFARLGYTMEESAKMAESAIVYKNVADGLDNIEESTDSIISTMKAFGIESDNTMGIVDRFNEVGINMPKPYSNMWFSR